MKIIYFLILSIFLLFSSIIPAQEKTTKAGYVKIEVKGLSCPFCAYGLEKKLRNSIEKLDDLQIDFKKGTVTFKFPDGKKPGEKLLKNIVSEAGFETKSIAYLNKPPVKKTDE